MLSKDETKIDKIWKRQLSRANLLPSISINITYSPFDAPYGISLKSNLNALNLGIVSPIDAQSLYVVMHSDQWFNLVKRAGYADRSHCPHCDSNQIKKDGRTIKGIQNYYCHQCKHYFNQRTKAD